MHKSATPRIIALSVALYRCLLSLAPTAFRNQFAVQILQVFRDCCRDAYQQKGFSGVLALWPAFFGEAIKGLLAEYLFPYNGGGRNNMQQTIRRSIITTFSAFVLFGTGYVALARVADPVAPFNAVAQVHPVVGIAFKIFTYSGLLAFLVIVLGGLPILFTAIKHALPGGLRGVFTLFIIMPRRALKLFVASLLITICFLGFLLATEYIFRSPSSSCAPGGCIAAQPLLLIALSLIALTTLIVFILLAIITSLSQVVSRGEFSQPLLRFALFPITIITLIMACATIAVATWVASLWLLAPQFAASDAGLGNGQTAWVIAITLSMAIATALSALTLHNALHTP